MRYFCYFCGKSVSSELPDDSVIRAVLICPECIENRQVIFKEDLTRITWDKEGNRVVTKIEK